MDDAIAVHGESGLELTTQMRNILRFGVGYLTAERLAAKLLATLNSGLLWADDGIVLIERKGQLSATTRFGHQVDIAPDSGTHERRQDRASRRGGMTTPLIAGARCRYYFRTLTGSTSILVT